MLFSSIRPKNTTKGQWERQLEDEQVKTRKIQKKILFCKIRFGEKMVNSQ